MGHNYLKTMLLLDTFSLIFVWFRKQHYFHANQGIQEKNEYES